MLLTIRRETSRLPHSIAASIRLGVVADEAFVDVGEFAAGPAKHAHAFTIAGQIGIALDRDELIVPKILQDPPCGPSPHPC